MQSTKPLKHKGNMKKLLNKVRRKKQPEEPAGRITTDTLAEHRERVLAGGRKFKYPVQYQRHKLVINTIIISIAAVILLVAAGWYLLYPAQNSSEFMYRVTRAIPVPVAVVDGQSVPYSNYLMQYRSSVHYLVEKGQLDTRSEDGKRQLEYVKSQSMDYVVADAYAAKLARELKLEVTAAELETFLKQQRQSGDGTEISEASYNSVVQDYYGWSPEEYREVMKSKLLRQKVAFAVDEAAAQTVTSIETLVKDGTTDLEKLADTLNKQNEGAVIYSQPEWVPRDNRDGGLAEAAGKLEKGQISQAIQKTTTGDGYYFVKLVDSNETQVQYAVLFVPLTTFDEKLTSVKSDGKLTKFIAVEDLTSAE